MKNFRPAARPSAALPAAWRWCLVFVCLGALNVHAGAVRPPTISSFGPTRGYPGDTIVINGAGFVTPLTVSFGGGAVANFTNPISLIGSVSGTRISVIVPEKTQTGLVTVSTPGGVASTAEAFVVPVSPPTLTPTPRPTPTPTPTPPPTPPPPTPTPPPPPPTPTPVPVPQVFVAATVRQAHWSGTLPGTFTFNLSAPQATKTVIHYALSGSAVNGTDYEKLDGQVKIKPELISATVEIIPKGMLGGAKHKKVRLLLTPESGYTVGTATPVIVKIEK